MTDFKTEYINYINSITPDDSLANKISKQQKSGGHKSMNKLVKTAVVVIAVTTTVFATGVATYAYEGIKTLFNFGTDNVVVTYDLTSVEASFDDLTYDNQNMLFTKYFNNISDINDKYEINVKTSNLAHSWDSEETVLIGYKDGNDFLGVRIISPYYIMGDLPVKPEVMHKPTEADILWGGELYGNSITDDVYEGKKYQTPVQCEIYINTSGKNVENTFTYEGIGNYTKYRSAKNGFDCAIVEKPFKQGGDKKNVNPIVKAYCFDGCAEYTLSGRVSVDTMKEIIDSFK